MKCSGAKCVTPIMGPNPMPDFGMQMPGMPMGGVPPMPMAFPGPTPTAIEAMMQPPMAIPRPPFDNFVFKQKNRFGNNLRG